MILTPIFLPNDLWIGGKSRGDHIATRLSYDVYSHPWREMGVQGFTYLTAKLRTGRVFSADYHDKLSYACGGDWITIISTLKIV